MYRLLVLFHEQEKVNDQWRDKRKYIHDWYEKPRKDGLVVPNHTYYQKRINQFMLGMNYKENPKTTFKMAILYQNTGRQEPLRRWEYQLELETTFRRLLKFGDEDCMNLIRKYVKLAEKNYPTSYHICKTLIEYFNRYSAGEFPEACSPMVQLFMVKANNYTKILFDELKQDS